MKQNILITGLLIMAIAGVFVLKEHKKEPAEQASQVSVPLPRLLELGSVQCVPCKMMAPILDELKDTFSGQLQVDFIDVWQQKEAGEQYGISIIPTQIFFDTDGNELFRHEGFFSREDILNKWAELGVNLSNEYQKETNE